MIDSSSYLRCAFSRRTTWNEMLFSWTNHVSICQQHCGSEYENLHLWYASLHSYVAHLRSTGYEFRTIRLGANCELRIQSCKKLTIFDALSFECILLLFVLERDCNKYPIWIFIYPEKKSICECNIYIRWRIIRFFNAIFAI